MACMAIIMGLGLLFYILLAFRYRVPYGGFYFLDPCRGLGPSCEGHQPAKRSTTWSAPKEPHYVGAVGTQALNSRP